MSRYHRAAGFTLIELIITIVILAIVASFAIPSFQGTVRDNRLTSQINETTSLINYARSEASKLREGVVTVCGSTDGASATPTCSASAAWSTGLIVFRDIDGDQTLDTADGDQLLKVRGALSGGNSLTMLGLSSDGGNWVEFSSNGFPVPSTTNTAGTFIICDERGATRARAIVVILSGQTRLARDTDGSGALNDHAGADISCP